MTKQIQPTKDDIKKANAAIEALKESFSSNRLQFELACSTYLSGVYNKILRQAVVFVCSNELRPATDCTLLKVAEVLTGHFQQKSLF